MAQAEHQNGESVERSRELNERYQAERQKRIRADGVGQYLETTDAYLPHADDPYAGPDAGREALKEQVDVVIIGGGFSGLLLSVRLLQAGIKDFRVIEKGADFGGTWYWNRYPGLACDIDSYVYIPLLEEIGYIPKEKYAKGAEILAHVRAIAEKFGLYDKAVLRTSVNGMTWDAALDRWIVSSDRGDRFQARFVITAGGLLHKPKLPAVKGLGEFKGTWFHTSRWDYVYTGGDSYGNLEGLKDKRVGIIGTGATAVQCVPHLGAAAEHLFVFQRTPSSVDIRGNQPTDPAWAKTLKPGWQQQRMENFNAFANGADPGHDLVDDAWSQTFQRLFGSKTADPDMQRQAELRQAEDLQKMEELRARVDSIIKDSVLAESLKPFYNWFCKRPCFHDDYLETFNRENVTLVDTQGQGIDQITETGIVALGKTYDLDCIVFATGFEFELSVDYTRRLGFEIYGRDGTALSERWRDGALTMHGMHTYGFPNYLICSVMQAGLSPSITHLLNEQAKHVAYILNYCKTHDIARVEVSEAAEAEWVQTIIALGGPQRSFHSECTPSYVNNEGNLASLASMRNALYGNGSASFFDVLKRWRETDSMAGLDCAAGEVVDRDEAQMRNSA